jgi:protocatechuate 3,4-dioxygenase beta subunit
MMTTAVRRTVLTLVVAAFPAVAVSAADLSGRIAGEGAKPVARAVVLILPEGPAKPATTKPVRVETGEDGRFVATGLTGESFRIRIEAGGYAPSTQPGIPAGASVQLRLRPGAKLSGVVRDRVAGTPIDRATVLVWDKDAEPFGEAAYRKGTSGKDGRFVVADLSTGKATVEARAAGHAPAKSSNVAIPKADLELLLDRPGGLTGLVTDTAGDPVAGAEVKASWRDATGPRSRTAKTSADGRYRIADAATLPLTRVAVRAAAFLVSEREGPAPSDGVLDFVLERGGSVAGLVRGYDGKIPPSFAVKVSLVSGSSSKSKPQRDFTDPTGAFRVDELEPGTYTIEVTADTYARVTSEEVDVAAEQVADAGTLTLQSRSVLRGRVVAARDRSPVSSATVRVSLVVGPDRPAAAGSKTSWTETTGADGTFATTALPDGTFDIVLEHPQYATLNKRVPFRPDSDTPELVLEMYRGGSLTGTVLGPGLDPVAGVHIVATSATDGESRVADTGPDGRYFIDGLAPGAYAVVRQGDRPDNTAGVDKKVATINEGETTTVDFDEKPAVLVSGVVYRGETPIPNAAIHFVPLDVDNPRTGASTRSDGEGGFQVGLRHGGRYQVSVVFGVTGAANGHNVLTLTIPDLPEVRQDIVFNVQAITGRVVDTERIGVKGALVTAFRDGAAAGASPRQSTTMSGEDGAFRLEAIDPGTYRVTARARGYGAGEVYPVAVSEAEPDPTVELSLTRGWIMRGRLLDPEGGGVPGALVVVAPEGAAESGYLPAQTDGTGAFRITAPADGAVNVAAISPRFAPAVQTGIEPPAEGDAAEVVLRATAGGSLRVRVVRRGGDPVPGAVVTYRPIPLFPGADVVVERNRPRSTDADGTTVVTMLYPTTYVVTVVGRRDAVPGQVVVNEGAESAIVLEVP